MVHIHTVWESLYKDLSTQVTAVGTFLLYFSTATSCCSHRTQNIIETHKDRWLKYTHEIKSHIPCMSLRLQRCRFTLDDCHPRTSAFGELCCRNEEKLYILGLERSDQTSPCVRDSPGSELCVPCHGDLNLKTWWSTHLRVLLEIWGLTWPTQQVRPGFLISPLC